MDEPATSPDELHLCVFEADVDAHPRAALARALNYCMSQRRTTATQKRYDGMLYGPGADEATLRAVRCPQISSVDQLVAWAGADLAPEARAHTIKSARSLLALGVHPSPPIELLLEACPESQLDSAIAAVDEPLGIAPPPWVARALDGQPEPRLALATRVQASRRRPVQWARAFARHRAQFRKDVTVEFQLDAKKIEPVREAIEMLSSSALFGLQLHAHQRSTSIEPLVDSLPEGLRLLGVSDPSRDGLLALRRCSALRSVRDLRVMSSEPVDGALDDLGLAFERLQRLDVMIFARGDASVLKRLCSSGRLGALEELRLYGSRVADADLAALAEAAPDGTLRKLELADVSLSPEGASRLGRLAAFAGVESLSVRASSDWQESAAIDFVRSCRMGSLAHFEWTDFRIAPEQARSVVTALSANASFAGLRALNLTQLSDAALYAMAASGPLARLERLELATIAASDDAMLAMLRSPWLERVRSLSISASMSEPVALAICAAPSLAQVEALQIAPRQLTASFATALRDASFARSLRRLTVFSSMATEDTAAALCHERLRAQLQRLTLTRKAFSPDAQWALKRAYGPAVNLI
jgi:hypothetical protein